MLYSWALVNSYSRIYLGVHFISDVIPGIAVGILFGWIVCKLYVFVRKKLPADNASGNPPPVYSRNRLDIILYMLILTIGIILVLSLLYSLGRMPAITLR
jgi:undecaprenyl-diphosphatase